MGGNYERIISENHLFLSPGLYTRLDTHITAGDEWLSERIWRHPHTFQKSIIPLNLILTSGVGGAARTEILEISFLLLQGRCLEALTCHTVVSFPKIQTLTKLG